MMVLISAERATLDDETNALRTERLACRLKREGIPCERGRGTWGGRSEAVFAVPCDGPRLLRLAAIAEEFQQDALLWVDALGGALLYWLADMTVEPLGSWREVTEAEAKVAGDWTELGGRYWRAG